MFKRLALPAFASLGLCLLQPLASAQGSFESTGLGDIDPWGIGAISRAEGALPVDMWQGSEADTVKRLLDRVNVRGLTPVSRSLLTRILLSASQAPVGDENNEVLAQRMNLIWELGQFEPYIEIAERLPETEGIMSAQQARIELQFARGNNATACSNVRNSTETSAYMFQARAVCFALEDNYSSADLALELGQEFDGMDSWIRTAINTLRSLPEDEAELAEVKLPPAKLDSGLTIALTMAGKFPVANTQLAMVNPGFAREISRRKDVDRKLRIDTADRAGLAGLMTPEQVRQAYRLDPVKLAPQPQAQPMQLPNADGSVPEPQDSEEEVETETEEDLTNAPVNPLDEALQIAANPTSEPEDVARALRRVLLLSQSNSNQYKLTASVLGPELNQLRDLKAIGDNAEFFALAALAAGNNGLANRFQRMPDIEGGPEENTYLQAWLNGIRIVNGSDRSAASTRTVSSVLAEEATSPNFSQTAKMLNVFLTFDGVISSNAVQFFAGPAANMLASGTNMSPSTEVLILANLKAGSEGEALLRAMDALGQSPSSLNSVDLNSILRLLVSNGFEAEARSIALEGLNYQRPGQ